MTSDRVGGSGGCKPCDRPDRGSGTLAASRRTQALLLTRLGKTTLALALAAVTTDANGRALVVDVDP